MLPDGSYDRDYAEWLADTPARADTGDLLVAVDGDDLLGTVTWCPPGSPHRQLATSDHQGELRTLSVSPDARRRGVGGALVAACLQRATDLGLTEVVLGSLPEMAPAHLLYTGFGFERRPDLDWDPIPGLTLWSFAARLDPHRGPTGG